MSPGSAPLPFSPSPNIQTQANGSLASSSTLTVSKVLTTSNTPCHFLSYCAFLLIYVSYLRPSSRICILRAGGSVLLSSVLLPPRTVPGSRYLQNKWMLLDTLSPQIHTSVTSSLLSSPTFVPPHSAPDIPHRLPVRWSSLHSSRASHSAAGRCRLQWLALLSKSNLRGSPALSKC